MSEGAAPLEVRSLTVDYGGSRALDGVSLEVPPHTAVGLIGPNGAGKTTCFDCISGLIAPTGGEVLVFGRPVTHWPIHRRVHLGVGRTFQRFELFGSLTVRENLIAATEASSRRGGLVPDLLRLPSAISERKAAESRADDLLRVLGLTEYAHTRCSDLPVGLSRIVELGRALCSNPRLLLLDEPTGGLDAPGRERLASLLRRLRTRGRRSLLIVEHDMGFVLDLCDYIYVLDFGVLIAAGPPETIRRDRRVQAAYLGEEEPDAAAPRG